MPCDRKIYVLRERGADEDDSEREREAGKGDSRVVAIVEEKEEKNYPPLLYARRREGRG